MKLKLLLTLIVLGLITPKLFATAADSVKEPNWGKYELVEKYTLGPGITYQKFVYPDKPLLVWFTEIDLSNPLNKVEQAESRNAVPDLDRWTVQTFSKENSHEGHDVKVAWNHDFFSYDQAVCIGSNISNGEMTRTKWGRSMLAITQDKLAKVFNPNNMECKATAPDGTAVDIDYYNQMLLEMDGDCILYNRFNSMTLSAAGKYIKIAPMDPWTVNGAPIRCKVTAISSEPLQSSATEYVLYLRNGKLTALDGHLNVDDILTVTQKFNTPKWGTAPANILNGLHGYPSIIHDGVFHDGEYNDFESGREYEKSSRTMVGISKDGTKLYVVVTELSENSVGVDCVELASWLALRGSNDVINFDSGGSAAIVVDDEMLNLPGRGSVRPVKDAMLAISLAPTDNNVDHLAFSKPQLNPSVISLTPLRVLSFNKYDEPLDKDLQGCTFTCEPTTMGYIDKDAIFHSSGSAQSGRILATKDGVTCEIPVTTTPLDSVYPRLSSLTIDNYRKHLVEVLGVTGAETLSLDAGAFNWTSDNEAICTVEDGVITGLKNGEATITGSFEGVSFDIKVKVCVATAPQTVADFSNLANFKVTKSSVSNISITSSPLPAGWAQGNVLNFDYTSGRTVTMKFEPLSKDVYGLPDSISLVMANPNGVLKSLTYTVIDNNNKTITKLIDATSKVDDVYTFSCSEDGVPYAIDRYPIRLYSLSFTLVPSKAMTGATLPIKYFSAFYPGNSGVNSVFANSGSNKLNVTVASEIMNIRYDSSNVQKGMISIYSTTGSLLSTQNVELNSGINQINVNVKDATTGVYIVTLSTLNGTAVGKCIIR